MGGQVMETWAVGHRLAGPYPNRVATHWPVRANLTIVRVDTVRMGGAEVHQPAWGVANELA